MQHDSFSNWIAYDKLNSQHFLFKAIAWRFPVWWTAPNLIFNITFQRIFVHRIQKLHPFSNKLIVF